jgi:hypothetical protein
MDEVGKSLVEQKGSLPNLKNPKGTPGFTWPSDQFLKELNRPSTIGEKFTDYEIAEMLQRAFHQQGLKGHAVRICHHVQFQFDQL